MLRILAGRGAGAADSPFCPLDPQQEAALGDPANRATMPELEARVREIGAFFALAGEIDSVRPWGSGHINDTYLVGTRSADGPRRYVFQRVNGTVFTDPEALMQNIVRVTAHLEARIAADPGGSGLRALTLVGRRDGGPPFHRDHGGDCWRVSPYVENSTSHDRTTDPHVAREAARAFGEFVRLLADVPPPRLHETIPGFHDTPARVETLRAAIAADPQGRAGAVRPEIDAALERAGGAGRLHEMLREGHLVERVTHGDTKLNNILFDATTERAICVVDLDTVMPGLAAHDFGDLVRSATNAAAEDESDPSRIHMQMPIFEGLARGWTDALGTGPDDAEVLVEASLLMTFELAIRFLADHLLGDVYFRIRRPGQNLDRCRNQLQLLRSMDEQRQQMIRCIADR